MLYDGHHREGHARVDRAERADHADRGRALLERPRASPPG